MKDNTKIKLLKTSGMSTILLSGIGGVSVYEFLIKPQDEIGKELTGAWDMLMNNMFIESSGFKLNLVFALPFLIGLIVSLFIVLKKNKSYFKDKISMGLMIFTLCVYLIYSLIAYTLSGLIGALVGTIIYEFVNEPIIQKLEKKVIDEKDVNKEYHKEKARLKAKKDHDYEGTV